MENFECILCDYKTTRSNDMKKHEKTQKHLRYKYVNTYSAKNDLLLNGSDVITKNVADKKSQNNDIKYIIDDKKSQDDLLTDISNVKKSQNVICIETEKKPTKKETKFTCECEKQFTHQSNLSRHKKICDMINCKQTNSKQTLEIQELKQQVAKMNVLEEKVIQMEELIKSIGVNQHTLTNNTNSSNTTTHSNNKLCSDNTVNNTNTINNTNKISVIAYLNSNYNEAPPIKMLEKADITKLLISDKLGDHSITDWIVFEHSHCRLHDFLGEFIVKEFKKSEPQKQQVYISDIPRLKFIVRQALGKDDSVWQNDPRGVCLIKYIITPMLEEVKLMLQEYITTNKLKMNTCDIDQCEMLESKSKSAFNTIFNINQKTLHKKILRFIAPFFHLELSDIIEEIDDIEEVKLIN